MARHPGSFFTVTAEHPGELQIGDHSLPIGFRMNLRYTFTTAAGVSPITFLTEENAPIEIDPETYEISVRPGVTEAACTQVTAKTNYHEVTFRVHLKTAEELESPRGVAPGQTHLTRFRQLLSEVSASATQNSTLLVGDSFMDARYFLTDAAQRFAGENVHAMGVSATQAAQWIWFGQELAQLQPRNLVISLGTNDLFDAKCTAEKAAENLLLLFADWHSRMPETNLCWFTVIPRINRPVNDIETVNDRVRTFAGETAWLTVVDTYDTFRKDTSLYRANDTVHPACPAGYDTMFRMAKEAGLSFKP